MEAPKADPAEGPGDYLQGLTKAVLQSGNQLESHRLERGGFREVFFGFDEKVSDLVPRFTSFDRYLQAARSGPRARG